MQMNYAQHTEQSTIYKIDDAGLSYQNNMQTEDRLQQIKQQNSQVELGDTENKSFSSVFVKEEPFEEEMENEQDLEQNFLSVESCAIKEESGIEEKKDEKILFTQQHLLPDVNIVIQEEAVRKERTNQHLNMSFSSVINCTIKEEPTVEEGGGIGENEHSTDQCVLPDVNIVIKEEATGEDRTEDNHLDETYMSAHVNNNINEEATAVVLNFDQRIAGSNQCETDISNKISSHSSDLLEQHKSNMNFEQSNMCNIIITQQNHVSKYKLSRSNIKKHPCDICSKSFTRLNHLFKHKLIHYGIKNYKCDICNKTFTQSGSLSEHKFVHDTIKKYRCDICNKGFSRARDLSRHKLIIHAGVKKYQCNICNKNFSWSSGLSDHKLTHSGVKKYVCDVCNKAFCSSSVLSRHKLIHTGTDKYKCDVCNKTFTQSGNLSDHKLLHASNEKYKCDVCNKTFSRPRYLSRHKLIHTDIRKYQCDICNKAFTRSCDLSQHKLVHSGIKKYQCDVCNKTYTHSGSLSKHNKLFHSSMTK